MRNFVICAIVVLVGGMIATAQLSSAQTVTRDGGIWTYKVAHVKNLVGDAGAIDAMVPALEKSLNDAGAKGWELCQEINGSVVFKRRK